MLRGEWIDFLKNRASQQKTKRDQHVADLFRAPSRTWTLDPLINSREKNPTLQLFLLLYNKTFYFLLLFVLVFSYIFGQILVDFLAHIFDIALTYHILGGFYLLHVFTSSAETH